MNVDLRSEFWLEDQHAISDGFEIEQLRAVVLTILTQWNVRVVNEIFVNPTPRALPHFAAFPFFTSKINNHQSSIVNQIRPHPLRLASSGRAKWL